MKYDLLVFTQYPNVYAPTRFFEEARKNNLRIKIYSYSKILNIDKLPQTKFVILREPNPKPELYKLRDEILNYYISKETKVLNSRSYLKWPVLDKITQTKEFEKAKIPHIKLLKLDDARYPFIVKNKLGSHGDSVYKIKHSEDLGEVLLKHKIDDLLIQEFQTAGFDLRVIVLKGKVLGIMKRTPKKGEFLSNYSQGGKVEKLIINNEQSKIIKNTAIKAAKHFRLDYVGVDLMKDNRGQWVVLEVNRACQFKGFEKATGVNVAKELINF